MEEEEEEESEGQREEREGWRTASAPLSPPFIAGTTAPPSPLLLLGG